MVDKIEVKFSVNSNGMVEVSAFDKRSGERNEIMIINNDGLTTSEIQDIKTRIDRGEEPEVLSQEEEVFTYKHAAEESLVKLQEFLKENEKFKLIDYGFTYRKDKYPQDDLTWFLFRRKTN